MNLLRTRTTLALSMLLLPALAHAYLGPGAGITAIGTVIALLGAILLAIIGFIWYPMKRMMKKNRPGVEPPVEGAPSESSDRDPDAKTSRPGESKTGS